MSSPPAFILSDEFIEGLFHCAKTWKDVSSLLGVSRQFQCIGLKQKLKIPLIIDENFDFTSAYFATSMATNIHVNYNSTETQESFFYDIVNTFKNCLYVGLTIKNEYDERMFMKICKIIIKKGILLDVLEGPNIKNALEIIDNMAKKYSMIHEEYFHKQEERKVVKRKRVADDDDVDDNFMMLKVPKNSQAQQRYLLQHLLTLTSSSSNSVDFSVNNTNTFARISHINNYTSDINITRLLYTDFSEAQSQIKQFVNCIAVFGNFKLLITSFDVFHHNHLFDDDCAHSMVSIFTSPTCKISRKSNTNRYFTECSIFVGHFELLVVGGYMQGHGAITPFLGSSLNQFNLNEETAASILVPVEVSEPVLTTRIVNQFFKRRSHLKWEFNCSRSFLKGFYPISNIDLLNHTSQKHVRQFSQHYFSSLALNLFSSPKAIKEEDIQSLWAFMIRLPTYKKTLVTRSSNNFGDLSTLLRDIDDDSFFSKVVHMAALVESRTPCFFFALVNESEAKEFGLAFHSHLKSVIKSNHDAIIKSVKRDL